MDPNGVASDVVIDGQDFGTNARPAALACSGTELHVGFWSVSAGVIVWDLATGQVVDQLTNADGMSNSAVYYDAMADGRARKCSFHRRGLRHEQRRAVMPCTTWPTAFPPSENKGPSSPPWTAHQTERWCTASPASSGYSQVGTWWPTTGASLIGSRIQLNSGSVSALAGSGTTLYAATYDPIAGFGSSTGGSALLIGDVASNGTLTWPRAMMPSGMRASSLAIGSKPCTLRPPQGVAETVEGKALVS